MRRYMQLLLAILLLLPWCVDRAVTADEPSITDAEIQAVQKRLCLQQGCAYPSELWSEGEDALLATVSALTIVIDDEVTDGCWPRPSAVREALEVELRRSGFTVIAELGPGQHPASPQLVFTAVGGELGKGSLELCAASVTLALRFLVVVEVTGKASILMDVDVSLRQGVLAGQKDRMQEMIKNAVMERWTSLYLKILKARERVFAAHPELETALAGKYWPPVPEDAFETLLRRRQGEEGQTP